MILIESFSYPYVFVWFLLIWLSNLCLGHTIGHMHKSIRMRSISKPMAKLLFLSWQKKSFYLWVILHQKYHMIMMGITCILNFISVNISNLVMCCLTIIPWVIMTLIMICDMLFFDPLDEWL